MIKLEDSFKTLPIDFQNLLRLAQDTHNIEITPLQELKGGRTGAYLFLVSVTILQSNKVQHFILKLDRKSKKTKMDELERHSTAIKQSPGSFVHDHIADLAFERIELDEKVAIFYSIAGQSLYQFKSLASYQQQHILEKIFSMTNKLLLAEWNKASKFEKAVHPQKLIAKWLGYRLQPGGNIEQFIENICNIDQDTQGLMIQGQVFPNPLVFSRKTELWEKIRPIDTITGFQHGDLNIGNILAKFSENDTDLTGYYLIDFALFKTGMPLLYDLRYLEMSYLIRELERVSFSKWVNMVTRFADQDIIDPHRVPIELSGTCAVINAGRNSFNDWVHEFYPSLSDDLWGQFWLAAVAAGLNYCNKTAINETERLAGLIFAAVHLKRYHTVFGVPHPVEVKYLNIINQGETAEDNTGALQHKTIKHNLPLQATPFIGRQKEITKLTELLQHEDIRLITLTGPGGTGKTRLSLQAAKELIDHFKDGVYFIDLAPQREPESVLASIASTIGLRETSNKSIIDELKEKLQSKKMLLLLDNFEQVTTAASKIRELFLDCPRLKLLITSREALHLRGEHVFPVPPLGLPRTDFKQKTVEQLTQFEAVKLFIDRALTVKPDFAVTDENAQSVAEICLRLDGLPLAIELAVARINLFSPKALLERIGLKLLRGGARDLPTRQQTLRDTINWSYEMLNNGEQQLFSLLSIFSSCTFEAIEKIADQIKELDKSEFDILDGITSLIDKSLIRKIEQGSGESRFLMLETIREYAAERLDENSGFAASAHQEHAIYYADFTQNLRKQLTGSARESTLMEIEYDIENMKIAWRYWVAERNLEQLHKLTDSLWLIYDAKGWYYATVDLTRDLLNVLATIPSTQELAKQEIMLQTSLARALMSIKGCTPEVEEAYSHALELCKKFGEIPQSFPILRALSGFYLYVGDFKRAAHFGKSILDLAEQVKDSHMRVEGEIVYGYCLVFSGDPIQGLEYLQKDVSNYDHTFHGSHGFEFGVNPGVSCRSATALCLWMLGFPDQALKLADDAISLANKLNHPYSMAYALFHTGLFHLWRGEMDIVGERARATQEIAEKHEFPIWSAVSICLRGAALAGKGETENGLEKFKKGITMYNELSTPPVFWPLLLLVQSGILIQSGQPKESIILIDEALKVLGEDRENPLLAEVYRLKGDVLLLISSDNHTTAESLFIKALDIARKQQTLMFELKASISLTRLWQQQGKTEGQQILKDTYNKFTEGFTTVDLIEAQKLLSNVS